MGGGQEFFQSTLWEQIAAARTMDEGRRNAVLNELLGRYWKPVYCYLRQKGYDNEQAKDLTQGFFVEVVLGRELVRKASPGGGRFRSFLLRALNWYAIDKHRQEMRTPKRQAIGTEWSGPSGDFEPVEDATPDRTFDRVWACELLNEVIAEAQEACRQAGQVKHWEVFGAWDLRPILDGTPRPPMKEICKRLGLESEKAAHNMSVTVKRRFRRILESRVRPLVGCEADVEQEINDLIRTFSQGGADA